MSNIINPIQKHIILTTLFLLPKIFKLVKASGNKNIRAEITPNKTPCCLKIFITAFASIICGNPGLIPVSKEARIIFPSKKTLYNAEAKKIDK